MKYFSRFAAIALVALSVGGCAWLQDIRDKGDAVVSAVTQTTVTPRDAVIAVNGFNALEITATNYNRLRRCTGTNGPICRDPAARMEIRKWVLSGRVARNDVMHYLRTHPGQNIAIRSFQDLLDAKSALQAIIDKYKTS